MKDATMPAVEAPEAEVPVPEFPSVSVVCSTWGRYWLLEEMAQSVVDQDYPGDIQLIVVNDAPVELKLAPDVELPANREIEFVNLEEPAPCNPWKRDLGVSLATGEWCTNYDDDDIMLPHRFSRQVAMALDTGCDWLASHVAAVWNGKEYIEIADNFFFCSHLWRTAMMPSGPERTPDWDDVTAAARLRAAGAVEHRIDKSNAELADVVHVYCWGGGDAHHSGISGDGTALSKERIFKMACARNPKWRTGQVELRPHLNHPYAEAWQAYADRHWGTR